jgi:hypothetical protein
LWKIPKTRSKKKFSKRKNNRFSVAFRAVFGRKSAGQREFFRFSNKKNARAKNERVHFSKTMPIVETPADLCGFRFGFRLKLGRAFGVNADEFAFLAFVFKLDEAFDQSKKRIVFAASDVFARFPFRAALTRQNIAAENVLTAEFFEPESLSGRIAPVS